MITRKQYLDHDKTHREYYGQFVTPAMLEIVRETIGLDTIKRSTDEHFNDIPLQRWDGLAHQPEFREPFRLKLKEAGDTLSLSAVVCVAKEAARQMK